MTTVRELLTDALLMLGIVAEGELLSGTQADRALRIFNSMLDGWATEKLLVYTMDRQVFALAAGTQTYTLGPGGTWNTTPLYGAGSARPVRVSTPTWRDAGQDLELPVNLMDEDEYRSLVLRGMSSTIVTDLYYSPTFPLGEVFVWPRPTITAQMVLWLWHPYNTQQTLDFDLVFPQGYERALVYNVAVELSMRYPGSLRAELATLAGESKDKIKLLNHTVPVLRSDLAGAGAGGDSWTAFRSGG